MNILCVGDEKNVLEQHVSFCRKLPQAPAVVGFSTAAEALDWLRENSADIALLDIRMPDMNGITLAKRIKENYPGTSIVFVSGSGQYAVDAYRVHASGYLIKPISYRDVADEVAHILSEASCMDLPKTNAPAKSTCALS